MDIVEAFLAQPQLVPEKAALLLVLTGSRHEEEELRQALERDGRYRVAVTELGAKIPSFRTKLVGAVLGASLNNGVITKTPGQVHALIHASKEALAGVLGGEEVHGDVAAKIAVVRGGQWLAVAMFGDLAEHVVVDHKRCGLGVMHLPV